MLKKHFQNENTTILVEKYLYLIIIQSKTMYSMLHKILKIDGVLALDKAQQEKVNGGRRQCFSNGVCFDCGHYCAEIQCCFCDPDL